MWLCAFRLCVCLIVCLCAYEEEMHKQNRLSVNKKRVFNLTHLYGIGSCAHTQPSLLCMTHTHKHTCTHTCITILSVRFCRPPWAHHPAQQHQTARKTPTAVTMRISLALRRKVGDFHINCRCALIIIINLFADTPQNSPYRIQKLPRGGRASTQSLNGVGAGGAIPRTRKLSNSSMASDVSFRLPTYDAPAVSP